MEAVVYYVVRQRRGWSVEQGGMVRSGHATLEEAIQNARARAASAKGCDCRVRIQGESGAWREERSFSPAAGISEQRA